MESVAANFANALGNLVGGGEDLVSLLVEEEVVIAEVRTRDVPMKVLGLEIEREHVGKKLIERCGDVAPGVGAKVGRGLQRRRAALLDVPVHGRSPLGCSVDRALI
jgi:hypothetical protein